MGIYEKFPYTNLQNVNIDWLLNAVKDSQSKINNVYENMNSLIDDAVYKRIDEKLTDDGLKEYINQYLSQFTVNVFRDLMKAGFKPSDVKIYNVGASYDYKNLTSVINQLSENEPCVIYLHEGVYNTFDEKSVGTLGITVPNYCYIQGVGDRNKIILSAILESQQDPYYSGLNLSSNCGVSNFTIRSKNVRYSIHDDFDDTFVKGSGIPSTTVRRVDSMILVGDTNAMRWTYGAGIKPGAQLFLTNCNIIAQNGNGQIPFSIHNMTGDDSPSYVNFDNCVFYSDTSENNCRFTNVTDYENSAIYGKTYITFSNCSNISVIFDNETPAGSGENTFYIGSDNPIFAKNTATQGAGWGFINAPNIEKMYPYHTDVAKGTAVFDNNVHQVATLKIADETLRTALISGVGSENSVSTKNVVTIFKYGKTLPSWIGYDFGDSVNKYVNLKADSTFELSDSKVANTVGFLNNYGVIELWKK